MELNIGIIGLGVGEAHIKGYLSHSSSKVVALCDVDRCKVDRATVKYPDCRVTISDDDILSDPNIQVVSIASYDNFHYEQIVKAIEHDKHVFVEKPFVLFAKEARHVRMLLEDKPHIKISSNLILRKCPRFIWLKEQIETGALGEIFYVEGDYNYGRIHKIKEGWRGDIDYYSVVYGGGIHIVDLILWLTKSKIKEVSAYGTNLSTKDSKFKFNDTVVAILKFENGKIGKISSNFSCVYPHFHKLSVYGTEATFENGMDFARLYDSRDPKVCPKIINEEYPGVHKGDLLFDFIDSIVKDEQPEISKDEIFDSMSVCFAIEDAIKKKTVNVEYI